MCEQAEDHRRWLDPLISKVSAHLSKEFKDVRYDLSTPDNSFFFSTMYFVNITASSTRGENAEKKRTISVVIKKPSHLEQLRKILKTDAQFHNEILFYERYAKGDKELPYCFYTDERPPIDSVIVLENVGQRGYELCQRRYDVPMEYTLAAFRGIARFHAKGYAMKQHRAKEFFELVGDIWETRYSQDNSLKVPIDGTATRSVEYLRKQGHDKNFCDKLEARLENAFEDVIMKYVEQEEPLATLCHGDFTLNNTFFKRETDGLKVMFIDFALMRYGSPVIDLSTFLCLHCATDLNKDMLEKVLKAYHDSLTECLMEHGIEEPEKYSYRAIYDDYRKKGLFGFFIATFFLSMVMGKNDCSPEDIALIDTPEWGKLLREMGGDEISEILANMLLQLKEIGCLDHLID